MEDYEARLPKGVNPQRSPLWMFDSNYVFPNFSLFVFADMFFTYHFWPLAVDQTLWETKTYYPPPAMQGNCSARSMPSARSAIPGSKT